MASLIPVRVTDVSSNYSFEQGFGGKADMRSSLRSVLNQQARVKRTYIATAEITVDMQPTEGKNYRKEISRMTKRFSDKTTTKNPGINRHRRVHASKDVCNRQIVLIGPNMYVFVRLHYRTI